MLERIDSDLNQSFVVAINYRNSMDLPSLPFKLNGFPDNYIYCGAATYPVGSQRIEIWKTKI